MALTFSSMRTDFFLKSYLGEFICMKSLGMSKILFQKKRNMVGEHKQPDIKILFYIELK